MIGGHLCTLAVLACLMSFLRAQLELQRVLMNITTPNGSEFVLHHDLHDTRLYLTNPSPLYPQIKYTMLVHSRDRVALKVDIIKFENGISGDHYDITDMTERFVRPITNNVLTELERLCPDIFYACKLIREQGFRKNTQVRRHIPQKIQRLLPLFPAIYERVVFAAMGPFFRHLEEQIPGTFRVHPLKDNLDAQALFQVLKVHQKSTQANAPVFSFGIGGIDDHGRPTAMQASFGLEGIKMAIQSGQASIKTLYEDEGYFKQRYFR